MNISHEFLRIRKEAEVKHLQSIDWKQIPRFTWKGIAQWCVVVRVIDADTIEIGRLCSETVPDTRSPSVDHVRKDSLRLFGVDAPEMHPRGSDHRMKEKEKVAAGIASAHLRAFFEHFGNLVFAVFHKEEKFGRALSLCYVLSSKNNSVICVQEFLLQTKLCKAYDGGHKFPWTLEELDSIVASKEAHLCCHLHN